MKAEERKIMTYPSLLESPQVRAVLAMIGVLRTAKGYEVRVMATAALRLIGVKGVLHVLTRITELDDDPIVRKYTAEAVEWIERLNAAK